MKRYRNYIYIFATLFIVGLFIITNNKTAMEHSGLESSKKPVPDTGTDLGRKLESESVVLSGDNQKNISTQLSSKVALSKQELYIQTDATFKWQAEHLGYFYTGILPSDYDNYDLETLEQLGKQGDMRAFDMLAWRYKKMKNNKAALSAYQDASVLGSTEVLEKIAQLTYNGRGPREMLLHRLDYLQTAVLRGDQQALASAEIKMKVLNDNHSKLTTLEINKIQQQGLARYLRMEKERKKRGLPRFDNTTPEYTKKFYSRARKLIGSNGPRVEESVFITSVE